MNDKKVSTTQDELLTELIHNNATTQIYPTGFPQLDKVLDGGLYEGLYVLGADTSLGKTTFTLQIADNLAIQGHDVLIFSLDTARTELMAKSVSRISALEAVRQRLGLTQAKTSRGITTGSRYANYSQKEKDLINQSVKLYGEYSSNVYIQEGISTTGVQSVRNIVEQHIEATGKRPIVLIDYLQILAPYSERATDKQNTDKAVLELKRLSRDFKIPVWAVSSFNRGSYDKAVTMSSFKESGAVEYSADVLIGMELTGIGTKNFNEQKAMDKEERELDIKILKNRYGKSGELIRFNFHSMFNYFEEAQ